MDRESVDTLDLSIAVTDQNTTTGKNTSTSKFEKFIPCPSIGPKLFIDQLQQFSHISAVIHVQVIDLDDTAPVFDLDLSSFEILEFDDLGAGFSSTIIFLFTFQFQQKGIASCL